MNRQKNILLKMLIIVAIVFVIIIGIIITFLLTQKPIELVIANVDVSVINDGIYIGSADNGLVTATVSVEVSNGKIQNISILEHDTLLGKPAEKIIDDIIEQQSLDVYAISSATYSSDTIRKALENALRQGEGE